MWGSFWGRQTIKQAIAAWLCEKLGWAECRAWRTLGRVGALGYIW